MLPSMLNLIALAFLESEMFDNITTKELVLHAGLVDGSQRANVWKYVASVVDGYAT